MVRDCARVNGGKWAEKKRALQASNKNGPFASWPPFVPSACRVGTFYSKWKTQCPFPISPSSLSANQWLAEHESSTSRALVEHEPTGGGRPWLPLGARVKQTTRSQMIGGRSRRSRRSQHCGRRGHLFPWATFILEQERGRPFIVGLVHCCGLELMVTRVGCERAPMGRGLQRAKAARTGPPRKRCSDFTSALFTHRFRGMATGRSLSLEA